MGTIMSTELDTLITLLEEGAKSEGRGLRIASYSGLYKSKDARLAIIDQLKQLRTLEKFDHYPTA